MAVMAVTEVLAIGIEEIGGFGSFGKIWEDLGRFGKVLEDLDRLGKIWEVFNLD